ncbi:MAG: FAD-binding protein [Clostridiales bacterium]|nr:FAD-binding protein [Clostridiales bacterium]
MNEIRINLDGIALRVCETGTLVIGSGCAGFNAADWLYDFGAADIMLITEGVNKGASRNTGSDKQTYYKLSIAAGEADSIDDMTDTLCGAGVHGDIALAEAASSLQAFFKLANLGVPFPTNEFGEFVGYKTDHDPRQRATSAGPLTSKLMTEALERSVRKKGVPVVDGMQAVKLLTDGDKLLGVLAIDLSGVSQPDEAFVYFRCDNAILATGGPACVYSASVYPESQTGMTGMAIDAGAELCNFSEWQYGLASVGFRWNVSGTYQQVLPRYIAVDNFGVEREFLNDYFDDPFHAADLVFLKGYQWPFDVAKIRGSSQIDMIVHHETAVLGNRVYMDFTRNPSCIEREGFSKLDGTVQDYLKNSGALAGTPIERLQIMNTPAIELYRDNGIDITREPLGVAVCAQHCNGGLAVDANWQTSIEGLYAAGEAAGTFGVYRPGGSALNSTQTGSLRAAQYIARHYSNPPDTGRLSEAEKNVSDIYEYIKQISYGTANAFGIKELNDLKDEIKQNMSVNGAFLRSAASARDGIDFCLNRVDMMENRLRINSRRCLPEVFRIKNIILTQLAYLGSIARYISDGGKSRGSYLISKNGETENVVMDTEHARLALVTELNADGSVRCFWEDVRPIPEEDNWFENVWRDYRDGKVIT